MRKKRSKLSSVAWLAAAIVVAGLIAAARLATYAPPKDPVLVTYHEAKQAHQAVETARFEIAKVNEAALAGKRQPFKVQLAQQDVTNYLRSDERVTRALASKQVAEPRVEFRDQSVTSSAYLTYHGRKVFVTVVGQLSRTTAGKMVFRSTSVMFGRLPAPGAVYGKIDNAINDYLQSNGMNLPAEITEIQTEDGVLTLEGISAPETVSP